MSQIFNILQIVAIILCIHMVKPNPPTSGDELTLRNQLFADVYLLKEGVDRLQISVEVLNKRYSNQIDMLKEIQLNFNADNNEDVCFKMGTFINTTSRKLNSFEFKILTKLEQIQEEQTTLLDVIKMKRDSNKSCSSVDYISPLALNTTSPMLSDVNKKVDEFGHKLTKLEAMEEMFKSQQLKLEKYNEDQMKVLQEINAKLTKNQEHFERFEKELPSIKDMINNMNHVAVRKEPTKLPMALLLGLTNANLTKS